MNAFWSWHWIYKKHYANLNEKCLCKSIHDMKNSRIFLEFLDLILCIEIFFGIHYWLDYFYILITSPIAHCILKIFLKD
jgi:hypothetical protein